ncbi:uncharacterized protein LOC114523466 [Dendronephthya gigantea]|uniref:uncharacterized protein LOC114523466 n=1 Tax=Dendronephthya gigantea TaxID=151771 RepID=UPI0010697486|nr:uncharacterized protein LOC114523466 [Dendronephthya gigantea]
MEGDLIFVNIDPGYNIASDAIEELKKSGRLEEMNQQRSWLEAIQSNVDGDNNVFKFGGENAGPDEAASAFAEIASSVFRMVMLQAVKISEDWWPELQENVMKRNTKALRSQVMSASPFHLLDKKNDNKKTARKYWRKYDHVFPQSTIESQVLENHGVSVNFHNKMLIFRSNFSEVIEIITEANAAMEPLGWNAGEFDSNVQVKCIRKEIKPSEEEGECFKKLKKLSSPEVEKANSRQRSRGEVLDLLENDKIDNLSDQVKKSFVSPNN